ncbi:MAG: PEGA domain-containing protein [Thermoanaerobaculia bacterium]
MFQGRKISTPATAATAAAFAVMLLAGQAVAAGEGRQRPPSDSGSQTTRVERTGGSSGSESHSSGSSSARSGGSSSVGSQGSTPSRSDHGSSGAGRTRSHGGSSGGAERVDRGHGGYYDGHRGDYGHSHHSYSHGYYYPRSYWGGWGWYYWPWWWDYPGYYDYPPRYYDRERYGAYAEGNGALDFDVSPENAEVYVDGQFVGTADDLDGFPSYLWLPKGTYEVTVYLDGYKTLTRTFKILPGVVLDVEDTLVPGPSVRPVPPPEPRDFGGRPPAVEDDDRYPSRDEPSEQEPSHSEMQGDAGRLKLSLIPSDATVYLDGHFLGTATELSRLHAGLLLDAGSHRLEIVRPGYKSVEKRVNVRAGEEIELEIQLEEAE